MLPEKPFFSERNYIQYSVVYSDFLARCLGRDLGTPKKSNHGKRTTVQYGAIESKKIETTSISNAASKVKIKIEPTRDSKAASEPKIKIEPTSISNAASEPKIKIEPTSISKAASEVKIKTEKDDKNVEKQLPRKGRLQWKVSSLTKVEHLQYLKLLEKYKYSPNFKFVGSVDQQQELQQFTALQRKVSLEREEFNNHLKNLSLTYRRKSYFYIYPQAKIFIKELLKTELKFISQECQSYYSTLQVIPLLAPGVDPMEKNSLCFIKNLLKLGQVPRFVPQTFGYIMRTNFFGLNRKYLLEKTNGQDLHPSKQNILKDSIACNLSLKYEADIVTTLKSLSTLIDNLHPNLSHSWEIPVMVITDNFGANGKIKRRVFLENPIPSADMSVRDQNTLYHEYVMKQRLVTDDHSTVKKRQYASRGSVEEVQCNREVHAFDDTFGDLNEETVNVDTFGIFSPLKQLNLNIMNSNLTDGAKKSSSGIQPENMTLPDYLEISSREDQISQDSTTTYDVKKPSNGNLISQNSTATDHMNKSLTENLIPENSTTIEDVTKSSNAKQILEPPASQVNLSDSDSDDNISDAGKVAFLKLKAMIMGCAMLDRLEEEQEMGTVKYGTQQNQDLSSDDLVIDSEDQKPTLLPIQDISIVDENEISIIKEIMDNKCTKRRERELKNSSDDNVEIKPDIVPKVEIIESSCGEDIALHDKSPASSPKSQEEKRKLYKKKSDRNKSVILTGDHLFESSDDMQLDISRETTKAKRRKKRCSPQSTECESSNSSPMQLRKRTVVSYREGITKSSKNTPLCDSSDLKQKKYNSTSSENEASFSSHRELRKKTVFRNIEDSSKSSENTFHPDSTILKQKKCNSTSSENELSQSSMVLRGKMKFKTIKEEPQSSEYQQNTLPSNSVTSNVSNDCHEPPKVNVRKNLSEVHSSDSICPKLENKPQKDTLDQILSLQQKLFNSPNSSADGDRSASLFNDSFPKQSVAMEEAPKDFPQLSNGNVSYSLWRLGKLKLMLRSEVDCQLPTTSTPCCLFSKMEYQCMNGMEVTTPSELMQQWIALKTCPGSQLVRIRIDACSSEIRKVEEVTLPKLTKEHKFHPDRAVHQASLILNTLTNLSDGHYMLVHKAQEPTLKLLKSVQTSKYGALDFHNNVSERISALDEDNRNNCLNKDVPWLPIDPEIIMPMHWQQGVIPGCFYPNGQKSYNEHLNSQKSQPKKKKKIHRKWKGNRNIKPKTKTS